jgi:hypothetical protein
MSPGDMIVAELVAGIGADNIWCTAAYLLRWDEAALPFTSGAT